MATISRKPDNKRWYSLSLAEQLANIGSEVARLEKLKKAGEREAMENSLSRTLSLLDLTLADTRWQGRRKEIARLREILCDFVFDKGLFDISAETLQGYFLPFALLVRKAT